MKDFDYYNTPKTKYTSYAEKREYKDALRKEIDDTPMTAKERESALAAISKKVREWEAEQNKPYYAERDMLVEEFWRDARSGMNYPDILDEKGMEILEAKAYQDGHSGGFGDVYHHLNELDDFVYNIKDHLVRDKPDYESC